MKWLPAAGTAERQRLLLLGAVMAALLGLWWWTRQPAEPTTAASKAVTTEDRNRTPLPVPEALRLATLEDVAVLDEAARNPFGFGVRPAPPAPTFRPVTAPPPVSVPLGPPPPQGPPPIGLTLSGITMPTPGGRTLVTLRDPATNTVYVAREGEIIDGRYRVVKVGLESVVVSYVDGSGSRTIPLGG